MSLSPPKALVRKFLRAPARFVRREVLPTLLKPASAPLNIPIKRVRVVGLLSSASGIGQSARLCIDTLRRAGLHVSTDDVSDLFGTNDGVSYAADSPQATPDISIFHLNPPMLLPAVIRSRLSSYYKSYNVGYWAWELETLPPEWVEATRFIDAVMVPSRFCQSAVERATSKPVLLVPHPVESRVGLNPHQPRPADRPFRVLTIFSFGSSFERKNPLALVAAFKLAFGADTTAELILKTNGGNRHLADLGRLRSAIGDAGNIRLIDEVWSPESLNDLLLSADVYASLHRSEGFGLPIADAIMRDIPVIATGWSGNMDFCPPGSKDVVDYDLISLEDAHTDYSQVQSARWADPSAHHAAQLLRETRDDYAAAQSRARRVKAHLREHLAASTYSHALAALEKHASMSCMPQREQSKALA